MRDASHQDIEVLHAHHAERESKGMGEVISALARQGFSRTARPLRNGVPLLPTRKGAKTVTLGLVNQLGDDWV